MGELGMGLRNWMSSSGEGDLSREGLVAPDTDHLPKCLFLYIRVDLIGVAKRKQIRDFYSILLVYTYKSNFALYYLRVSSML